MLMTPLHSPTAKSLFDAALAARAHAYVPYSNFAVGAAVRTETGAIFAGTNVENASYPVGTCAEAGAIAAMIAGGGRVIVEALVLGGSSQALTPCGACRQRLREFAGPDALIHAAGLEGITATFTLGALLPEAFVLNR